VNHGAPTLTRLQSIAPPPPQRLQTSCVRQGLALFLRCEAIGSTKNEPPTPDRFIYFSIGRFRKRPLKTRGARAPARGSFRCSDLPQEIGSHIALLAGKGRSWGLSGKGGPRFCRGLGPKERVPSHPLHPQCSLYCRRDRAGPSGYAFWGSNFCRHVSLWRGCTGPLGPEGCAGPVGRAGCSKTLVCAERGTGRRLHLLRSSAPLSPGNQKHPHAGPSAFKDGPHLVGGRHHYRR
jgi:hypothetical protein